MAGSKLTPAQVAEMRRLSAEEGRSARSLAKQFGVHHKTVGDILAGRSWADPAATPPPTAATAAEQAWRGKVADARKKRRPPRVLSLDKYNTMWAAYQENQATASVARVAGVSETCAQKYIDRGDPSRGLRPLRERLARSLEQQQRHEDYSLSRARDDQLRIARAALAKLAQRIASADPTQIPEQQMTKMLREVQLVMDRAYGLMDAPGAGGAQQEGRFTRWTEEELAAFLEEGTLPLHDVSIGGGMRQSEH